MMPNDQLALFSAAHNEGMSDNTNVAAQNRKKLRRVESMGKG